MPGKRLKTRSDKFTLTESQIADIERMAGMGLTVRQIASIFGVSRDTIYRRRQENPVLDAAFTRGVANANKQVAEALYHQAVVEGNVQAQSFWLSRRAGWNEKVLNEHTGKDGGAIEIKAGPLSEAEEKRLEELKKKLGDKA